MAPDRRLGTLHGIAAVLVRSFDRDEIARHAVRSARSLESADAASLMLEQDGALRIVAHDGISDEYAAAQRIPLERARQLYRGPDVHLDLDLMATPAGDPALIASEGLARALAVPLVAEGALVGSLNVYTRDQRRRFDEADVEVAHLLAAHVAAAITNARLYAEARRVSELNDRLLEVLGEGVYIVDAEQRITGFNRAMRDLTGLAEVPPTAEALRRALDVRGPDGQNVTAETTPFARALQREPAVGRFTLRHAKTGEDVTVDTTTSPVIDPHGTLLGAVMTVHDVSASVTADREREEFLSIVSHELKTPLTPLKALAQLIRGRIRRTREGGQALDMDALERNLMTIERQVDRMNGLVNDLLEVSRAGRGRFELAPAPTDLAPVVREMVQRYVDATAEEGRHRFSVDAPETLRAHADQSRYEQVLWNLLGNAVKYSPRGGLIAVSLSREGADAVLTITDQGIGIPADDLPRIGRRPFTRGSGGAASFAGMGIGLYLSRLVIEGHGGDLGVVSAGDGAGTTVRARIPVGHA